MKDISLNCKLPPLDKFLVSNFHSFFLNHIEEKFRTRCLFFALSAWKFGEKRGKKTENKETAVRKLKRDTGLR